MYCHPDDILENILFSKFVLYEGLSCILFIPRKYSSACVPDINALVHSFIPCSLFLGIGVRGSRRGEDWWPFCAGSYQTQTGLLSRLWGSAGEQGVKNFGVHRLYCREAPTQSTSDPWTRLSAANCSRTSCMTTILNGLNPTAVT